MCLWDRLSNGSMWGPHPLHYHWRDENLKFLTFYLPFPGIGSMLQHFGIVMQQLICTDICHTIITMDSIDVARSIVLLRIHDYLNTPHHPDISLIWQVWCCRWQSRSDALHNRTTSFCDKGFTVPSWHTMFIYPNRVNSFCKLVCPCMYLACIYYYLPLTT